MRSDKTSVLFFFQVVNLWETSGSQMPKQKKIEESRTSALRFCKSDKKVGFYILNNYVRSSYMCFQSLVGRQKFVREVLKAAPLSCESEEEATRKRVHFHRPAANKPTSERQTPSTTNHSVKLLWQNPRKRERQSEKCDSPRHSPPTKRWSVSSLTTEDIDLLSRY